MAILGKIQDYKGKKSQADESQQPADWVNVEQSVGAPVNKGIPQDPALPVPVSEMKPQGEITAGANINNPVDEIPYQDARELHDAVVPRVRSDAIQNMSEDDFRRNAGAANISEKEYWAEQLKKDPNSTYAILANHLADAETPEEKRKRERREKISNTISGLGNVIANAANLYYTSQGAVPVDFVTPMKEEDERRRRVREKRDALKEKKDAILMNAKIGDINYARQTAAAKNKADTAHQEKVEQRATDLMKFNADMTYKQAKERAEIEFKEKQLEETKRHNKSMEAVGRSKVAVTAKQAEMKSSEDKNYDYLPFEDNFIPIPKSKARGLYSQLYQAMKRDPSLKGDQLENIILQLGEGGDMDGKMMNTVRRRINDSPAALNLLREYMGVSREDNAPAPFSEPWSDQDYGKGPGGNSLGINIGGSGKSKSLGIGLGKTK